MGQKKEFSLSGYNRHMNKAIKKLDLATVYIEDGAPIDAARCAAEAITALFSAATIRANAMTEAQVRWADTKEG